MESKKHYKLVGIFDIPGEGPHWNDVATEIKDLESAKFLLNDFSEYNKDCMFCIVNQEGKIIEGNFKIKNKRGKKYNFIKGWFVRNLRKKREKTNI